MIPRVFASMCAVTWPRRAAIGGHDHLHVGAAAPRVS
jgi:hypothetical protein